MRTGTASETSVPATESMQAAEPGPVRSGCGWRLVGALLVTALFGACAQLWSHETRREAGAAGPMSGLPIAAMHAMNHYRGFQLELDDRPLFKDSTAEFERRRTELLA